MVKFGRNVLEAQYEAGMICACEAGIANSPSECKEMCGNCNKKNTITVQDLIQELSSYPSNAEVFTTTNFRIVGSKLDRPLQVNLFVEE